MSASRNPYGYIVYDTEENDIVASDRRRDVADKIAEALTEWSREERFQVLPAERRLVEAFGDWCWTTEERLVGGVPMEVALVDEDEEDSE
ncbi:hypothetical protein [Dyella psychrodurans]|uniref:Uncharacterized protein n=1 Tax=Dyella psychrodurans TaxID=1927960 RepID=A0A370XBY3_9GAMM|nr:hypothetical protein [Dyella psychrodurans]RDS85918.1 hypothetical protein DWU99_01170 [Dyella psychrodurans]